MSLHVITNNDMTMNKKRFLSSLLVLFLGVIQLGYAATINVAGISYSYWFNTPTNRNEAFVTVPGSGIYYVGDIVIPTTFTLGNENECTVIGIDKGAFYNCTGLTSVTIPEGATTIKEGAFSGCSKLTSVNIPSTITIIEKQAFYRCSKLTSVAIPAGVSIIGDDTFLECNALTLISLPDGLTSIGESAFLRCTGLTEISIPSSVKSIGSAAFQGCSGLTDVYCYATDVPQTERSTFNAQDINNTILHVPSSAVDAYKNTAPWSNFKEILAITEEPDRIILPQSGKLASNGFYTIDGKKADKLSRGVNVIINKDGVPKKVIVK